MSRIIDNPTELILNKAKELMTRDGLNSLNMRSLSKACDIALGTIYNYYPTKKDLIVQMMVEYWEEYFRKLEAIESKDNTLYDKLREIFLELKEFIGRFREVWLKPELYAKPDYIKDGMKKENIYMEKLVKSIENILIKEQAVSSIQLKLGTHEVAQFIVLNFITIIQMPVLKYDSFEIILKELI